MSSKHNAATKHSPQPELLPPTVELRQIPPLGAVRVLGPCISVTAKDADAWPSYSELLSGGQDETRYFRITALGGDAHIRFCAPGEVVARDDLPLMQGETIILAVDDDQTKLGVQCAIGTRRVMVLAAPIESA